MFKYSEWKISVIALNDGTQKPYWVEAETLGEIYNSKKLAPQFRIDKEVSINNKILTVKEKLTASCLQNQNL